MSEYTLSSAAGPEAHLARAELFEAVNRALDHLPPRESAALWMRVYHQETYVAIASRLGVSYQVALLLVARAIRRLRHPSRSRPLAALRWP